MSGRQDIQAAWVVVHTLALQSNHKPRTEGVRFANPSWTIVMTGGGLVMRKGAA